MAILRKDLRLELRTLRDADGHADLHDRDLHRLPLRARPRRALRRPCGRRLLGDDPLRLVADDQPAALQRALAGRLRRRCCSRRSTATRSCWRRSKFLFLALTRAGDLRVRRLRADAARARTPTTEMLALIPICLLVNLGLATIGTLISALATDDLRARAAGAADDAAAVHPAADRRRRRRRRRSSRRCPRSSTSASGSALMGLYDAVFLLLADASSSTSSATEPAALSLRVAVGIGLRRPSSRPPCRRSARPS